MIKPKIVLISGSREASAELLECVRINVLRVWWNKDELIVGDAMGVDAKVVEVAQYLKTPYMAYGIQREARNGARHYTNIRARLDKTYAAYTSTMYRRRDEFMVRQADIVLCFWNERSLGTKYVYEYACNLGKDAYLVNENGVIENNRRIVQPRKKLQGAYQQVL